MIRTETIRELLNKTNPDKNFALGNDLLYMPDFQKSCTDLFKKKVYSANEIDYCELFSDPMLRYASTFAAKEAVYKAVKQLDKAPVGWKEIEIVRLKISGEPQVILHKQADKFNISLTISHDGDYVWAVALITISGDINRGV